MPRTANATSYKQGHARGGGGWNRGKRMPKRQVPCSGGCGALLWRATHLETAKCSSCVRKRDRVMERTQVKRLRLKAQRLKELMNALGWREQDFEKNLAKLRARIQTGSWRQANVIESSLM